MAKGYKKVTFKELLKFCDRTNVFYLLNRILKNQSTYIEHIGAWGKIGISQELFNYSANDHAYEYNLLQASCNDLELLMYRFIHKESGKLDELRQNEFKNEFKKKHIFLKTNKDFINKDMIDKINKLNGQKIINKRSDDTYYLNKIKLFTDGIRFIFCYGIAYQTSDKKYSGFYCGEYLNQKDNEKISIFINRGYEWLISMLDNSKDTK